MEVRAVKVTGKLVWDLLKKLMKEAEKLGGLTGINSSQLVVRTSTYADFAAVPLPTGRVNITGIFTRFRNTWQILIRQKSDIQTIQ